MNEQLIVKNFGPFQIEEVKVNFKRVTVFIGPTGGGKSTLAKLSALFKNGLNDFKNENWNIDSYYKSRRMNQYASTETNLTWVRENGLHSSISGDGIISESEEKSWSNELSSNSLIKKMLSTEPNLLAKIFPGKPDSELSIIAEQLSKITNEQLLHSLTTATKTSETTYFPADRSLLPVVEYSWAGFIRDDIGLPKDVLDFANSFSIARKDVLQLDIRFLNAEYIHHNGHDFIKIPGTEKLFRLYETASGIQSVTPLLVLLEYLNRNTEQAQSFIIEEPELNLYPTAQQGLLNWLVEKCTQGENDLTITTHSPYILSHLNLLLYAYQVAEKHPERAEEVAEVVPRASWINPREFACYQVENGGVTSLVNDELGLIDDNGLDNLSGDAADAFDNLIRLSKGVARK